MSVFNWLNSVKLIVLIVLLVLFFNGRCVMMSGLWFVFMMLSRIGCLVDIIFCIRLFGIMVL